LRDLSFLYMSLRIIEYANEVAIKIGGPKLAQLARVVGDKSFFHTGEAIEIEISYSTPSEKKYLGGWTSCREPR
jgi:hypothetical protein